MSTYTVTMSIGQPDDHEEIITASDDDAAIEAARFAVCEWMKETEGYWCADYWYPVAMGTVDVYYEVWTGGRMIDQGSITLDREPSTSTPGGTA